MWVYTLLFFLVQDNFRYIPGKSSGSSRFKGVTERYIFLFQMVFLVTKKEEDGYQYKAHLSVSCCDKDRFTTYMYVTCRVMLHCIAIVSRRRNRTLVYLCSN